MRDLLLIGVAAAALLAVSVVAVAARPFLGRLALRNMVRRRSRLVIVVFGLMIGTAIITSSLVVGDTLEHIFTKDVYERLDRVDEYVVKQSFSAFGDPEFRPFPQTYFDRVRDSLVQNGSPVDGVAPGLLRFVPVRDLDSGRGHPSIWIAGFDDTYEDAFGPLLLRDGTPAPLARLLPGEAYVNERAAHELGADLGDRLEIVAGPTLPVLRVRDIVQNVGKANWERRPQIFLSLAEAQATLTTANLLSLNWTGQINIIRVSNVGDVATGVEHSDRVESDLSRAVVLNALPVDVVAAKQDGLREARAISEEVTSIFLVMGGFTIFAGVLLIVNIFAMLTEERKGEMGVARAVGMQRGHVLLAFLIEGTMYSTIAAAVGALAGLGLGFLIIYAFGVIFPPPEPGLILEFHFDPASVVFAFCAGVATSFASVLAASVRAAYLNIVRAIRDTAEPPVQGRPALLALGALITAAGAGSFLFGLSWDNGLGKIGGPPLMFLGLATLALFWTQPRFPFTAAGAAMLYWVLWPPIDTVNEGGDDTFILLILTGLLLVFAAVLIVLFNMSDALKAFDATLGRRRGHPVLKTAVSYPMQRKFRTGMTFAMFSLIIFTVTIVSMIQGMQAANLPRILDTQTGGFDIVGYTPTEIPGFRQELANRSVPESSFNDGYNGTATAIVATPLMRRAGDLTDHTGVFLFGVDNYLVRQNSFAFTRHAESVRDENGTVVPLRDAADVWLATYLTTREGNNTVYYAVVDRSASSDAFSNVSGAFRVDVGQRVVASQNNRTVTLEIIGVLEQSLTQGIFTSRAAVADGLNVTRAPAFYFFDLAVGVDASEVSEELRSAFLAEGMVTVNLRDSIAQVFNTFTQVLTLMQAYLALGLLVGIAGLAIIMIRAVVERRQQIGALRAIGFTRRMIARTFLVEIAFISVLGTLIGMVLGVALAYRIHVVYFANLVEFSIPYLQLAGIVVASLLATLLFTIWPALRAARIPPAEALRYIE